MPGRAGADVHTKHAIASTYTHTRTHTRHVPTRAQGAAQSRCGNRVREIDERETYLYSKSDEIPGILFNETMCLWLRFLTSLEAFKLFASLHN